MGVIQTITHNTFPKQGGFNRKKSITVLSLQF